MGKKLAEGGCCRTAERLPRAAECLVRKLVAEVSQPAKMPIGRPTNGHAGTEPDDVIFTGEVDGVRYLLVRTHQAAGTSISLSPREQEIARMIAKGHANKTIAAVLDISVWTVSTHLRRIFAKMGVTSRTAMVARILTHRLV